MPRIRTVKPEHWGDKELPNIALQAHLLWLGIWNFSDDSGIIDADPLFIKSNIFPRRLDIRVEQVSQWLDQLVSARFLVPFKYENESYYVSRTFETHQKIDRPSPSKIPKEFIRRILDECSTNARPCIVEECRVEESSERGDKSPTHTLPEISAFEKFKEWILSNAPRVAKMKEPFTIQQFLKIKNKFTPNQVQELLKAMHNWEPLHKKNRSAFLTFIRWQKMDDERKPTRNEPTRVDTDEYLKKRKAQEERSRKLSQS